MTLEDWTTALARELGVSADVPLREVLDLARDAAHGVERPAAPLTTFLVGYAAGAGGGGPELTRDLFARASRLATTWASGDGPPPAA